MMFGDFGVDEELSDRNKEIPLSVVTKDQFLHSLKGGLNEALGEAIAARMIGRCGASSETDRLGEFVDDRVDEFTAIVRREDARESKVDENIQKSSGNTLSSFRWDSAEKSEARTNINGNKDIVVTIGSSRKRTSKIDTDVIER